MFLRPKAVDLGYVFLRPKAVDLGYVFLRPKAVDLGYVFLRPTAVDLGYKFQRLKDADLDAVSRIINTWQDYCNYHDDKNELIQICNNTDLIVYWRRIYEKYSTTNDVQYKNSIL